MGNVVPLNRAIKNIDAWKLFFPLNQFGSATAGYSTRIRNINPLNVVRTVRPETERIIHDYQAPMTEVFSHLLNIVPNKCNKLF